MIDTIKKLRLEVDTLMQLNHQIVFAKKEKDLKEWQYCQSVDRAGTSLKLAKAHLGDMLEQLGEKTLYKNDGNRNSVKDIEIAVDIANIDYESAPIAVWNDCNKIQKVDHLREEIKKILKKVSFKTALNEWAVPDDWEEHQEMDWFLSLSSVTLHLKEARFHLGFQLGEFKKYEAINGK